MSGYAPEYLHEKTLKNAVGKLYMLGHRAAHGKSSLEGAADSIGGMAAGVIDANRARDAQLALAKKEKEAAIQADKYGFHQDWASGNNKYGIDMRQKDSGVSQLAQGQFNRAADEAAQFEADKNYIAKAGLDNLQTNAEADKTRLGGVYSPNGMKLTQRDAQLNAMDRMKAKSLIGLGGSLRMNQ